MRFGSTLEGTALNPVWNSMRSVSRDYYAIRVLVQTYKVICCSTSPERDKAQGRLNRMLAAEVASAVRTHRFAFEGVRGNVRCSAREVFVNWNGMGFEIGAASPALRAAIRAQTGV